MTVKAVTPARPALGYSGPAHRGANGVPKDMTAKEDGAGPAGGDAGPEGSGSGEFPGSDRRKPKLAAKPATRSEVTFDAKGNPVWEVRVEAPRRREDDDTVDLLQILDSDELSLQDEEPETRTGYDPYARDDER